MSAVGLVVGVAGGRVSAVALGGWMAALCLACGASALWLRLARHAQLVADAGHELRGPLCAARLGLHGLDDAAAVDLELRRAALALDDLVAAGQGGRARGRSQLVDVGALLDDGAEAWAPLASAFGSSLSVEPLRGRALVRADPLRLAQACGNLVANALEHGGSPVRVRGRVVAGRVRVEVSDAGPGLPEPVSRLIARRRRGTPRGRGLAIAARIARDCGGRLSAAPSSSGARLVIELPSADAAPAIEPFPPSRFDPAWRPDTPLDPSWRRESTTSHLRRRRAPDVPQNLDPPSPAGPRRPPEPDPPPADAGRLLPAEPEPPPADAGRLLPAEPEPPPADAGRLLPPEPDPPPPPRPMTRRRRGALLIGLALALGGLAASDVGRREAAVRAELAPLVDVVVAGRDLPPRRRLTTADLALRRIPARYAPIGAASVPEEVVGRRLSSAARRGAYLGAGQLEDESAPAPPRMRRGERAVEVAGAGSPELVVAGARVDVVVVPERGGARLALSGAQVLAARPLAAADGADGAARVAATLRVTATQALALSSLEAGAREVRLLARTA